MWTPFGRFIFWLVIHPHLVEAWGILPDIRIKLRILKIKWVVRYIKTENIPLDYPKVKL